MKNCLFKITAIAALLIFPGCGVVQISDLPSSDLKRAYKFSYSMDGIKISADPFVEKERLEKYFGLDLISKNILPVFVLLENEYSEDGFLLSSEGELLVNQIGRRIILQPINPLQADYEPSATRVTIETLLCLGPIGQSMILADSANIFKIKHNLQAKYLSEKIVYKGDCQSGFLYFNINPRENSKLEGLNLKIKNVISNEFKLIQISLAE